MQNKKNYSRLTPFVYGRGSSESSSSSSSSSSSPSPSFWSPQEGSVKRLKLSLNKKRGTPFGQSVLHIDSNSSSSSSSSLDSRSGSEDGREVAPPPEGEEFPSVSFEGGSQSIDSQSDASHANEEVVEGKTEEVDSEDEGEGGEAQLKHPNANGIPISSCLLSASLCYQPSDMNHSMHSLCSAGVSPSLYRSRGRGRG